MGLTQSMIKSAKNKKDKALHREVIPEKDFVVGFFIKKD
jgi:hypothetical protein